MRHNLVSFTLKTRTDTTHVNTRASYSITSNGYKRWMRPNYISSRWVLAKLFIFTVYYCIEIRLDKLFFIVLQIKEKLNSKLRRSTSHNYYHVQICFWIILVPKNMFDMAQLIWNLINLCFIENIKSILYNDWHLCLVDLQCFMVKGSLVWKKQRREIFI